MKGLAASSDDSCGHHADLRNIPTVQLGEKLTSLYLSEQRAGPSAAASVSASGSQSSSHAGGSGGGGGEAGSSRKGKERAQGEGNTTQGGGRPTQRSREPSNTSLDTAKADSSAGGSEAASVAPSIPVSSGSGNSYSAELHDHLTPLREMYMSGPGANASGSSSKRRSVPTMGPIFDAAIFNTPPTSHPPGFAGQTSPSAYQAQGQGQGQGHAAAASHALSSASRGSPSMGLSEILATPSYREVNASRDAEYTTSPFERYSPSPGLQHAYNPTASREIDYFNLPISHREGSVSAHHHPPPPHPARGDVAGSSSGPPRPQSEPLPEDTSTPSWSSSDITSATQSSSLKSPRIRNEGMLAPHGSFTSASGRQYQAAAKLKRAESLSKESVSSSDSVQSWRSRTASERSTDASGRRQLSERQYVDYVRDAMNGDQLALYHLGWSQDRAHDRHSLGDAELVWGGAVEPTSPSAFSSRSSATSRPSLRSNSTTSFAQSYSSRMGSTPGPHPPEEGLRSREGSGGEHAAERPKFHSRRSTRESDLFSDVAHMTLQSNARNNRAGMTTPSPMGSPLERPRTASSSTTTQQPPHLQRPKSAVEKLEEANRLRDLERARQAGARSANKPKEPSHSSGSGDASRPTRKRDETKEERDLRRALRKAKQQQQQQQFELESSTTARSAGSGSTMRQHQRSSSSSAPAPARPAAGPLQPPPPNPQ